MNPIILKASVTSLRNVVSKLKSSGASAADLRELQTTWSMLYAEGERTSFHSQLQKEILAKSSEIMAYDRSNFNVYDATDKLRRIAPFDVVDVQRTCDSITQKAKETIISQGVLPSLKALISLFANAEQQAQGQGVLLSSTSSSVTGAHYQEVKVCSPAVIAGVLALGALFAPEVELGVIAGVVITSNTLLEAGSALYSIGAGIVC